MTPEHSATCLAHVAARISEGISCAHVGPSPSPGAAALALPPPSPPAAPRGRPSNGFARGGAGPKLQVKLVDYDLAKCCLGEQWEGSTPCGTLSYM